MTRLFAWLLPVLLCLVLTLNYLDRQVIFSLVPLIRNDVGISDIEIGLLGTTFLFVYGFLSPFAGYLSDRFDRRKIILTSLLLWSALTWVTGQARNISQLLAARGLMGFSEAFYLPAAQALIADCHAEGTRSRAISIHWSGLYFGAAFGGVFGGAIGERFGWRFVFTILGITGIAYGVVLLAVLFRAKWSMSSGASSNPRFFRSFIELWRLPNFALHCSLTAVASIARWIVYAWLPLYLYERFHQSLAVAGFTATFYLQAASVCGILAGRWLADRWSRTSDRGRLRTQFLGLIVAGPCLCVAGLTLSLRVLVIALLATGIGWGFQDGNTMPVMCQLTPPRLWATGQGVYNSVSCFVAGAMLLLSGVLKFTLGIGGAIAVSGVIVFVCAILLLRMRLEPVLQDVAVYAAR